MSKDQPPPLDGGCKEGIFQPNDHWRPTNALRAHLPRSRPHSAPLPSRCRFTGLLTLLIAGLDQLLTLLLSDEEAALGA